MSDLTDADHEQLARLEESLWRTETRFDREYMESVLAPDFLEVGRSGRTFSRAEILALEQAPIDAVLRDLSIRFLGPGVALATYVSELRHGDERSLAKRGSIWTRTNGRWMLRFHQGTPTGS